MVIYSRQNYRYKFYVRLLLLAQPLRLTLILIFQRLIIFIFHSMTFQFKPINKRAAADIENKVIILLKKPVDIV